MNTKYLTPATANACHPTMVVSSLLRLHDSKYTGLTNGFSKLSYYWSAALSAYVPKIVRQCFKKKSLIYTRVKASPVLEVL